MSYFENNAIENDNSGRGTTKWSTRRNSNERLRHRPHIVNTSNSRGEGYVQYYSSLDADIVFGDVFIDEVVSITWQVQQNAMPIFGYNSFTFDDIAVGSRMISGQFTVNFIEANYLSRVQSVMTSISRKTYGDDIPAKSSFSSLERQLRNLPKWDKGFNIVVGYGERNKSNAAEYNQVIILDCCQLTGCQQQLDYNGEPITETYSFIARDMQYVSNQQYNYDTTTDTPNYSSGAMDAIRAVINISGNNSEININISTDGSIVAGDILLGEIEPTIFNTKVQLTAIENGLQGYLTSSQKNAIAAYVSKTSLNKFNTTLYYSVQKDNDIKEKEASIIVEIIY